MPITKRAIKKMKADERKRLIHDMARSSLRKLIKAARKSPTDKARISSVFKALDKAAKWHIIHPNKAARLKSRLTKLTVKK